jgi:hypothetical protein
MVLLWEVVGFSWNFVGSIGSSELGIPTQVVVRSLVEGVGKFGGGLIVYICCMVSIINFPIFFQLPNLL